MIFVIILLTLAVLGFAGMLATDGWTMGFLGISTILYVYLAIKISDEGHDDEQGHDKD